MPPPPPSLKPLTPGLAEQVYALIGGMAHHSTAGSTDSHEQKASRRLHAMGQLELAGWSPCMKVSGWGRVVGGGRWERRVPA